MEVARPASVSQPKDLLMMDSNDVSFLDSLDSRNQVPSYAEPVQQHQPSEIQKPTEAYPALPSPRVETPVNIVMAQQEPVQIQAPTYVAPEQHNLYKTDSPREKPTEFYRSEIRVPTYVEPPKEKPVELYRGYPTLETPAVSNGPVYTPMKQQQQQLAAQQMPTIQLPSTQQVNQVVQTQQNISSIHTMSSQHLQQTKDMVVKFESYFDRMINWMESIDRRLSKLELTTNELQKGQQTIQQKLNSSPAPTTSSTPSMVPYFLPAPSALSTTSVPTASAQETLAPYEFETAMKLQQTLDSDAELAKKLQAEFEHESAKATTTKKPELKAVQEECPVCQKKISSKEFNDHVNECLDKASKDDKNGAQSGFFSRFFTKKTDAPATTAPEKTEVPLVKKPAPTTQTPAQITPPPMYPAFQPYMMPQTVQGAQGKPTATPTPYFFPQYPFQQAPNGQPMYYIPQGYPYPQAQPQPKK